MVPVASKLATEVRYHHGYVKSGGLKVGGAVVKDGLVSLNSMLYCAYTGTHSCFSSVFGVAVYQ